MDTTTPAHPLIALLPASRRLARRLTDSPDQADDLLHDAILGVWQQMQRNSPITRLRPYLATALRALPRLRHRAAPPPLPRGDRDAGPAGEAGGRLALHDVRAAIEHLPREQRDLVLLVLSGETSPADLARVTGLPPGTVMSRLARARASLRQRLGMAPGAPVAGLAS